MSEQRFNRRDTLKANHALATENRAERPKACILLWMTGGPSQLDTFDMKPDGPADSRGEFRPIDTAVPGIRICELLPKTAQQMRHIAILRSMSTGTGGPVHGQGYKAVRHFAVNPREQIARPNLGAIVSAELGNPELGLPNFISIGGTPGRRPTDTTPGFLGPRHAPLLVPSATAGLDHIAPLVDQRLFQDRVELLQQVNQGFQARLGAAPAIQAQQTNLAQSLRLMGSDKPRAFDLGRESERIRDVYGRNPFGEGCLLARRLVEVGVPFVEVVHANGYRADGGWDTHDNNFTRIRGRLTSELDAGMGGLLSDLHDRGLLETTLVVWMGEFGRTSRVNQNAGRDHYATAWTTLLAGCGVRGGQAIGATNASGDAVANRPIGAHDFLATICPQPASTIRATADRSNAEMAA
jgi:hypothetical protein